jgi:hypothetical protein
MENNKHFYKNTKVYKRDTLNILYGLILIVLACCIFVLFSFWLIISKLYQEKLNKENQIIKFLIEDKYYCLIIPILIPTTFIFLYLRWTAFSYFKYC